MDNAKKFIMPVIFVVVILAILSPFIFKAYKNRNFTIPGRSEMEAEIKKLGYDVGELDKSLQEYFGIEPFTKIYAKSKNSSGESGEKTGDKDISFVFFEYGDNNSAAKTMSDYFLNAQILKKSDKKSGTVKIFYNEKKNRAYALYNVRMNSDGFSENFVMSANSGNVMSKKEVNFLYGGIYMDGKRVVNITTTNPQEVSNISKALEDLGLPKS